MEYYDKNQLLPPPQLQEGTDFNEDKKGFKIQK